VVSHRGGTLARVIGAQLDLFDDRHVKLEHARRVFAEGRAADAHRELVRLGQCYPADPEIAAERDLAHTIARRLAEIDATAPCERPRLLVELAGVAPAGLRAPLWRRAALELRDASGPTALLDGKPASVLLLAAGDPAAAWATANEAAHRESRARFLSYLADADHRLGHAARARACYREALALDPYDVDWDEVADDEVRSLPDIARTELELEDGVAWSAPVGVVLRVLPVGEPPCLADPVRDRPHDPLAQARGFLAALIQATREPGANAIEARRQMRRLAPRLLAAYLESR